MALSRLSLDDWEMVPRRSSTPKQLHNFDMEDEPVDDEENVVGIFASLLIPGKGDPQNNQAVLLDKTSGKIIYVGSTSSIPSKYSDVELDRIEVLMPGMWECHSHFMGADPNRPINSENLGMTNPAEAGARNVRALKETL